MQRSSYFVPVVLALLFTMALTLIASSPVYGDTLTACQGTTTSTATVKLAGRVIYPSTLLQAANGQSCNPGDTQVSVLAYNHTVLVSPKGSDEDNGAALLSAMTTISNSNPSQTNPWLLKLEPGRYYLPEGTLVLVPYVDLEGSGEGTTLIYSFHDLHYGNPPSATVKLAANSEIRFLKISNISPDGNAAAAIASVGVGNSKLNHVNLQGGAEYSYGLYNTGGEITVLNSTISNPGLAESTAIYSDGSDANIIVQNSTVSANGNKGVGLYIQTGRATIKNSTLSGSGNESYAIRNDSGTVKVGASQLSGSTGLVQGSAVCAAAYNADFVSLNASCGV